MGQQRSMTEQETPRKLIVDGRVAKTLRQGSSARHAIRALQTLLHWLGFDRELNWKKFGADGDYGKATVAAVAEFARRNGSTVNGSRLSGALAEVIVARYDALEELKLVAEDIDRSRIGKHYKGGATDRIRIAALQTLLRELGFAEELNWEKYGADGDYGRSTTAAMTAFAKRHGLDGDGKTLTLPQAELIVSQLSRYYGDTWHTPVQRPIPARESLIINSVVGAKNRQFLEVSDGSHKKRFGKFRKGLFTTGNQKPGTFVTEQTARLRALKVTGSEINVMISVAENEGNLRAVQRS
jgi:peptidoglycan hydrolase-like protein with peptidoglycan-binding domain